MALAQEILQQDAVVEVQRIISNTFGEELRVAFVSDPRAAGSALLRNVVHVDRDNKFVLFVVNAASESCLYDARDINEDARLPNLVLHPQEGSLQPFGLSLVRAGEVAGVYGFLFHDEFGDATLDVARVLSKRDSRASNPLFLEELAANVAAAPVRARALSMTLDNGGSAAVSDVTDILMDMLNEDDERVGGLVAQKLGAGSFGEVFAFDREVDGRTLENTVVKVEVIDRPVRRVQEELAIQHRLAKLNIALPLADTPFQLIAVEYTVPPLGDFGATHLSGSAFFMQRATQSLHRFLRDLQRRDNATIERVVRDLERQIEANVTTMIFSGVVCADLKPDNMLLTRLEGGSPLDVRVYLSDFGYDFCGTDGRCNETIESLRIAHCNLLLFGFAFCATGWYSVTMFTAVADDVAEDLAMGEESDILRILARQCSDRFLCEGNPLLVMFRYLANGVNEAMGRKSKLPPLVFADRPSLALLSDILCCALTVFFEMSQEHAPARPMPPPTVHAMDAIAARCSAAAQGLWQPVREASTRAAAVPPQVQAGEVKAAEHDGRTWVRHMNTKENHASTGERKGHGTKASNVKEHGTKASNMQAAKDALRAKAAEFTALTGRDMGYGAVDADAVLWGPAV